MKRCLWGEMERLVATIETVSFHLMISIRKWEKLVGCIWHYPSEHPYDCCFQFSIIILHINKEVNITNICDMLALLWFIQPLAWQRVTFFRFNRKYCQGFWHGRRLVPYHERMKGAMRGWRMKSILRPQVGVMLLQQGQSLHLLKVFLSCLCSRIYSKRDYCVFCLSR